MRPDVRGCRQVLQPSHSTWNCRKGWRFRGNLSLEKILPKTGTISGLRTVGVDGACLQEWGNYQLLSQIKNVWIIEMIELVPTKNLFRSACNWGGAHACSSIRKQPPKRRQLSECGGNAGWSVHRHPFQLSANLQLRWTVPCPSRWHYKSTILSMQNSSFFRYRTQKLNLAR